MQFNVIRQDEFEIRNGYLGLSVQYADEHKTIPFVARTDDLEYQLTSSIAGMMRERMPRVAFITSFGAQSPFAMPELNQVLSSRYEVRSVNLEADSLGLVPPLSADSFDVIAFVGPTTPVSPAVVSVIDAYLEGGGAGLFLVENSQLNPQAPFTEMYDAGLGSIFEKRGIGVTAEMAYDLQSNQTVSLGRQSIFNLLTPYPLWPVAISTRTHATNRDLEVLSLAWAAVLEIQDSTRATPLWTTTEYGGRKPAMGSIDPQTAVTVQNVNQEDLGIQVLAAASVPGEQEGDDGAGGRIVVIGDADLLQGQFVQQSPQNLAFVANAIDWLAQDELLIEIRSKDRTPAPLQFSSDFQKSALKWGNMAGVPMLFVLLGFLRTVSRRKRAAQLWSQVERHIGGES